MAHLETIRVGEPFWAESKKAWVFRQFYADRSRAPKETKRKEEADIKKEHKRVLDQIELSGASTVYDFDTIAQFRSAQKLAAQAEVPLDTVLRKVIEELSNSLVDITVSQAWQAYYSGDFKKYHEPTTQSTKKSTLDKFAQKFSDTSIGAISEDQVFEYAETLRHQLGRTSLGREMTTIKRFIDWAISRPQRYLKSNPFQAFKIAEFWPVSNEEKAQATPPKIHTPKEIQVLLDTCLEHDPLLLPALALKTFGFLRTCEVTKIKPGDIDINKLTIKVDGTVAKKSKNGTLRPRSIEKLHELIRCYLLPFSSPSGKLQFLDVKNFGRRLRTLYDLALPNHGEIENELRHSCITYAYIKTKDIGQVRHNAGHHGKTETVTWEHYINPTKYSDEADAFYAIYPPTDYAERIACFRKEVKHRTPNWPSDKKLRQLVDQKTLVEIGAIVGVSETAIRKRLAKTDIAPKPKGYWKHRKKLEEDLAKEAARQRKAG